MALNDEQQAQLDIQITVENLRNANQAAWQAKQTKLEAVRLAQNTLIENARSKPVDARDVSATDVTTFAETLVAYIQA